MEQEENEKKVFGSVVINKLNYRLTSILMISISVLFFVLVPFLQNPFASTHYYGRPILIEAPEFSLKNVEDQSINIKDFEGKYTYLMFGYIGCDELCHSQVLTFHALNEQLQHADVTFLYLGMDPENDSAEQVSAYFDSKGDNFMGLVAKDMPHAQRVAAKYNAYFSKRPSNIIDHAGMIYLIDPVGNIRLIYTGSEPNIALMVSDFNLIMTEFS